jgi:putative serine protease PepD
LGEFYKAMLASRLASFLAFLLTVNLSGCATTQKFGGSLSGGTVDQRDWLNAIEEIKSAVVKIEVTGCQSSGSGSGFIIDRWLVSNRHVLEGASSASFKRNGRLEVISKWYLSSTDDLALSPLSPSDLQGSLELGENDPIPGDLVAAAGFPWGGPEVSSFGRILSENSEGGASSLSYVIETNLDIHPGNSGGPLLDAGGHVVGVMFAIDTSTNSSLAIPLSRLVANINKSQKTFTSSSSC